jgi:hypothetical protein
MKLNCLRRRQADGTAGATMAAGNNLPVRVGSFLFTAASNTSAGQSEEIQKNGSNKENSIAQGRTAASGGAYDRDL